MGAPALHSAAPGINESTLLCTSIITITGITKNPWPKKMPPQPPPPPPTLNVILSFLLVGLAWGLTTPFIRRAAKDHRPPEHPVLASPAVRGSWWKARVYAALFAVSDLLRNPRYAVPLVLNLTGSVWFFLLIGQAGVPLFLLSFVVVVGC